MTDIGDLDGLNEKELNTIMFDMNESEEVRTAASNKLTEIVTQKSGPTYRLE